MTDNNCPHATNPDSGHATFLCTTCGGCVAECQIQNHVCDMHREYACSIHVDTRKKHIQTLEKKYTIQESDMLSSACYLFDHDVERHEPNYFHPGPLYYLEWEL